jgi:hypothetical protein
MFMEAATAVLLGGEVHVWRELARDNFDRDLGTVLRPSHRTTEPEALLRRSTTGWARIFDFGQMRIGDANGSRVMVKVDGFEAASLAMRYATIGTMEGLLRAAGAEPLGGRIMAGETSFARDFEYELSWRT